VDTIIWLSLNETLQPLKIAPTKRVIGDEIAKNAINHFLTIKIDKHHMKNLLINN